MVNNYIPKQGDIIYVDFAPTKGREQKGFRPAVVISNLVFNKHTKMAVVCPITSNKKEFPTHYLLEDSKNVKGSVLCEHMRSIDFDIRNIKYVEETSVNDFSNILELLMACL